MSKNMELHGWDPLFCSLFESMVGSMALEGRRAVFDADGTLWAGDAGRQMVHTMAERGLITTAAGVIDADGVLREYDAMEAAQPLTAYTWCVTAMASLPEATVIEVANVVAETMAPSAQFLPMRHLLQWLAKNQFESAVVSASNRWVIQAMIDHLQLPVTAVVAMDCELEDGKLTSRLREPLVNGPGKVDAILSRLGWADWAFAAGNSVHDIPMMNVAQCAALMVEPNDLAYTKAVQAGFWIRRFRPGLAG